MPRTLKSLVTFAGVAIAAMGIFWLLFRQPAFTCSASQRTLFMAGLPQFIILATVWGALVGGPLSQPLKDGRRLLVWAYALGTLFHVLHIVTSTTPDGIDLSISALAAIGMAQTLLLIALRRPRLAHREFRKAVARWSLVMVVSLLGVVSANILLSTIPCSDPAPPRLTLAGLLFSSAGWYITCGVFPGLVTALIYANETPSIHAS